MSTSITIDASDVATASDFLEQFLTDQVTDGDFGKGTALRDLAVNAVAAIVAFLRADAAQIRQMQSLKTVAAATGGDEEALRDALTGILSNVLVAPKGGTKARGFGVGHSSQQVDVFVAPTIRFTHTAGVDFVVDSEETLFIPAAELLPVVDADGFVLDYEFRVPMVAVATGEEYNVDPGLFASFDRFNPYITRVETIAKFSGGKGPETVDEILARAPTAVAVRNLINDRSIPATLNDNFDGIESMLVVGMGDPEMQRDIVPTIAPHLRFHIGGMVDIFLRTALVETTFTGAIGDLYERPDGLATIFRDSSVSFATVEPGDIIRIVAGLPTVPAEFLVLENDGTQLIVGERTPFPVATDEATPSTTVSYTIGRTAPNFDDVISDIGLQPYTTGVTSRRVFTPGRVTLPGGPIMDILDVAIINPPIGEASFKSTLDGFVHFPNQVNTTPAETATPTAGLQFQAVVHNPLYAQSAAQWMELVVGTDTNPGRFDTYQLRVRYRTIASFDVIDAFVRGPRERVLAAYQLPRGHHPVIVGLNFRYTLKPTATALLDDAEVAQTIVDYINLHDAATARIDVSSIIQLVKNTYPTMDNVIPATIGGPLLTISYVLRAPTGEVLSYATTDVVEVTAAKQIAGPAIALGDYGVTGRTLRFVANTTTVTAQQVA
jgi:hypothetical protein